VTCHGYASFDKDGKPNFAALGTTPADSPIGNIDDKLLQGFTPNDFIWGPIVRHAK
jgi:hypothetical protein